MLLREIGVSRPNRWKDSPFSSLTCSKTLYILDRFGNFLSSHRSVTLTFIHPVKFFKLCILFLVQELNLESCNLKLVWKKLRCIVNVYVLISKFQNHQSAKFVKEDSSKVRSFMSLYMKTLTVQIYTYNVCQNFSYWARIWQPFSYFKMYQASARQY